MNILTRIKILIAGVAVTSLYALPIYPRDINVDAIYIKRSAELNRLIDAKIELYSQAGATLAANDAAFAGWRSGNSVVFCRESSGSTIVQEFFLPTRTLRRVGIITGAPICFTVTNRYCLVKSAISANLSVSSFFSVLDIASGSMKKEKTPELFLDYSVSPFGSSYLRDGRDGIIEHYPESPLKKTLVRKSVYESSIQAGQPVAPFLSPDGSKVAVVSGAGGSYHAMIIEKGSITHTIDNISSAGEFAWIDSSTVAYRSGSPGYYRLAVLSLSDNKTRDIVTRTLNTNFTYCPANGLVAALEDGCLTLRSPRGSLTETYPLEGDDPSFSPSGNSIALLYSGKLFLVNREVMKKRLIEMRRTAAKILGMYRGVKSNKSLWENEFTPEYLDRKIALYRKFAD